MEKFLIFTIVGLTLAAIYAIISSGLVLTYTTTGIFNFAHGAIGMLAAFAYWQIRFQWGWPTPLALFVVIGVIAPLFGLMLERVIMRGLAGTSEATKLVVSISLLVGLIGLANLMWTPGQSRPMSTFYQGRRLDLGVTSITYHQAITIGVAIGVAIGLRWLLHRTRIGVSMRANVDDRSLALLNGARPDRIALISWAVGVGLAAVGGILIAPSLSLEAGSLSLLIVNAYAAAIFGRLRSLPLTFVGAIAIGLTEGYLAGYLPGDNRYLAGMRPAAAVIVLFLALLFVPNPRLRTRTQLREYFPSPSRTGTFALAGAVVAVGVVMVTTLDAGSLISYGPVFSLGIVALSLVPLVGFAGQISLAQLTFGGIGAIAVAHHGGGGSPLGLVLAMVFAAAVGALIALPVMRLSGIYLALATAAFGVAMDRWIFNLPDFDLGPIHVSLFNVNSTSIDALSLFGYRFDTPGRQLMLSAVAFAVVAVLVAALRWGRWGRQLVAMRDSEVACATFGLDLRWPRVGVFTLSAAIAGRGGALYGMQLGTVSPSRYDLLTGLPIFILVIVGGAGLIGGALFAGISLFGLIPLTSGLGPLFAKVNTIIPGLAGIGLGRNPSGVVPLMSDGVAPLRRDRPVLVAMTAAMVGAYALRLAGVIGNRPFALLLAVTFLVAGALASIRSTRPAPVAAAVASAELGAAASDGVATAALPERPNFERAGIEWAGLARAWSPADLTAMNDELGFDGTTRDGLAFVPAALVGAESPGGRPFEVRPAGNEQGVGNGGA